MQVDNTAPHQLQGSPVGNIIILLIADPALTNELRGARRIDWVLPIGRLSADVSGLGVAFDAIRACGRAVTPPR